MVNIMLSAPGLAPAPGNASIRSTLLISRTTGHASPVCDDRMRSGLVSACKRIGPRTDANLQLMGKVRRYSRVSSMAAAPTV